MFLLLLRTQMKSNRYIISGVAVWLIQLLLADLLAIKTVRPDFLAILILYWAIKYGRLHGTVSGFLIGILIDLSGTASFFGLSPLLYSITGYLSGNLKGAYSKLSPFYFSLAWVGILGLQFFIFCIVQYQDILYIDPRLFWMKWLGTTLYTFCFAGILQVIYPFHRLEPC